MTLAKSQLSRTEAHARECLRSLMHYASTTDLSNGYRYYGDTLYHLEI